MWVEGDGAPPPKKKKEEIDPILTRTGIFLQRVVGASQLLGLINGASTNLTNSSSTCCWKLRERQLGILWDYLNKTGSSLHSR